MNQSHLIAPALNIEIRPSNSAHTVTVRSRRPVLAADVLVGKSIEEALQLLPYLFSICGNAHAYAGVSAIENTLSVALDETLQQRRQAVVDLESIHEHLWRILLHWPGLVGSDALHKPMAQLLKLHQPLMQQLNPDGSLFRAMATPVIINSDSVQQAYKQLLIAVDHLVFDNQMNRWQELQSVDALANWAAQSNNPIAALITSLTQREWQSSGDGPISSLPELTTEIASQLSDRMQHDDFIAAPEWQGNYCEVSSLQRNNSTLLDHCRMTFGNGLLARTVAMVTDLMALIDGLGQWLSNQSDPFGYRAIACALGHTQAARGPLFHSVKCRQNRIDQYRILAPTEWNFHPLGTLNTALGQLRGSTQEIALQAKIFVELLNPCVAYDISVLDENKYHA